MIRIISHRGLDPSKPNFPFESSREAFEEHLARGFGVEIDPQRTADGYVVLHDSSLKRITNKTDERLVNQVRTDELLALDLNGSHLTTLHDLLALIDTRSAKGSISFVHLKHTFQIETTNLDVLLRELESFEIAKFILFDVTIETAQYLKERNNALRIAPSVAHRYDIKRYNEAVGGTLLPLEKALAHRDLFEWIWLDEWDLMDEDGSIKKFYTREVFDTCRKAGLMIALVTPELHRTSPGLLGGEAHPDAQNQQTLRNRLEEIVALRPDAVCTDYPDLLAEMTLAYNIPE
jgi:glycerophosphoryl diester phosphodiesterase